MSYHGSMTNTQTIPVIVQTYNEDTVPFVDWPVDDLPRVFDFVKAWGLVDSSGEQLNLTSMCADLVVHEGRVVFRISIMDVD